MSKTVFITGASTGIGRAAAQYFVQRGWNVAATMRSPRKAGAWADISHLITPYLDVTNRGSIEDAIEKTADLFGTIDVVVNNAGYGLTGPLEGISADQLEHQFQTNVFGLVAVMQAALPLMRRQNYGTFVNVSSIGGRVAFPFASAYHASKFAVEGLSESLRFELKRHNIRIKLVEPGGIKTDFITRSQQWATHPAYEPELSNMIEMTKRLNDNLPDPEAVARVIYRAACDRSDKLRYPAQPGSYLLMRRVLPDRLWRAVVGMALNMQAST